MLSNIQLLDLNNSLHNEIVELHGLLDDYEDSELGKCKQELDSVRNELMSVTAENALLKQQIKFRGLN